MKVLHVVESLGRGAVETWLLRMLRFARARGVTLDWTFYCTLDGPASGDEAARGLGARIEKSPVPLARKAAFMRALRGELRRGGYDVMHCHHDLVSGVYLLASAKLPISRRIVHVHNADEALPTPAYWKAGIARPFLRSVCLGMADRIAGISQHALDTFLNGRARRIGQDVVHYYGIDTAPFESAPTDRAAFRRAHGLPETCRVLLFAGRMVPEKNPLFALDVFAALHRRDPDTAAIFVGNGSLDAELQRRTAQYGLQTRVRQLGWRDDVAAILPCCDWFILPRPERPMEGFGIAVVEAQLAGLRMLLSQGIADDPLLPDACYRRLPLAAGAQTWVDAALALAHEPAPSREAARRALAASPMDMDRALAALTALHG